MERLTRRDFLKAAGAGLALTLTAVVTAPLVEINNLPVSNPVAERKRFQHLLNGQPAEYLIMGGLIRPFLEELIFRWLPSKLLNDQSRHLHWKMGLASSAVFAFLHHPLHPDRFPLSEFMAGMTYWGIMRRYGLQAAGLAHASTNTSLITLGLVNQNLTNQTL